MFFVGPSLWAAYTSLTLLKVHTAPEVRPEPGKRLRLSASAADVRLFDAVTGQALG